MKEIGKRIRELKTQVIPLELPPQNSQIVKLIHVLRSEGFTAQEVFDGMKNSGYENIHINTSNPPNVCILIEESIPFPA
ncbi:MAG: hypothetical protein Q7S11_04470 [bacterium]|nr:hypothetical protein [bacterium]